LRASRVSIAVKNTIQASTDTVRIHGTDISGKTGNVTLHAH